MKVVLPSTRIESIDLLRGIVMIIMALDHVRDYFSADAFLYNPTDLSQTNGLLFFTRWITHFCAPVFVFLAGTSAFQIGIRKGLPMLSSFLLKRGLWLILLEFTVINVGWFCNFRFSFIALTVIWALGLGMIIMAAIVRLPFKWILAIGLVLVFGHNLLDSIHFPGNVGWSLLHEQGIFSWGQGRSMFVGYPILAWVGVMALGYCMGSLYGPARSPAERRKALLRLGWGTTAFFILLRLSNLYGDPHPWVSLPSPGFTFLSFLNATKYPPSLLYLTMTIGPSLLFLAYAERVRGRLSDAVIAIGRVPLFFYVIHIYVIHCLAFFAAVVSGLPLGAMVFNQWVTDSPALKGYGFGLGTVYLVWAVVIAIMYPLCKRYEYFKRSNKDKEWLSYL